MTETFSYTPNYGASSARKPRVNKVSFGDGYEQRFVDGIHTLKEVWTMAFNDRELTEANAIDAFLQARGGIEYFYWTPPDGVEGKYVCDEWERSATFGSRRTITATFRQVFDA